MHHYYRQLTCSSQEQAQTSMIFRSMMHRTDEEPAPLLTSKKHPMESRLTRSKQFGLYIGPFLHRASPGPYYLFQGIMNCA